MKNWKPTLALIVLTLVFTMSEALYSKSRVTIADAVTGDAITAHCYSKDDDLGTHQLAYLQSFSWTFRYSLIGSTEFFCTISTQYGSGNYMVYGNDIMLNRCGLNCLWQVQAGGPCLQQTRGGLWCQPWQKHA